MSKNIPSYRVFFALELDEATRDFSEQVSAFLRQYYHGETMVWTKPGNLHITLRFIGAVPLEKIPSLISLAHAVLVNLPAFSLALGPVTFFPSHRPHALAINLIPALELSQTVTVLDDKLAGYGFAPETRSFQPHITLARLMRCLPPVPEIPAPLPATLPVNAVVLFKSESTPGGILYTPLERFLLRKN